MITFSTAEDFMKPELRNILKCCFNEQDGAIDILFKEKFNEDLTAVCMVDGKVVASVYIFENSLLYNNREIPTCYMYAVATLPEYQGNGYMKKLLGYAEHIARNHGKLFATLYPADTPLFAFYEKLAYQHFFKACIVKLDQIKIEKIINEYVENHGSFYDNKYQSAVMTKNKVNKKIDFLQISNIRKNVYNKNGMVCWDKDVIKYACDINTYYGGNTIIKGNSYAMCRKTNDTVEIVDCAVLPLDLLSLIDEINNQFKAQKYVFRLPPGSQLLGQCGKDIPFGMIKPLTSNENLNREILKIKNPYLGLVMD